MEIPRAKDRIGLIGPEIVLHSPIPQTKDRRVVGQAVMGIVVIENGAQGLIPGHNYVPSNTHKKSYIDFNTGTGCAERFTQFFRDYAASSLGSMCTGETLVERVVGWPLSGPATERWPLPETILPGEPYFITGPNGASALYSEQAILSTSTPDACLTLIEGTGLVTTRTEDYMKFFPDSELRYPTFDIRQK